MNRLTINDIARASLRTGKRTYISLAAGIFLSIFLITAICTCAQGVMAASDERAAQQIGYEDFILFDDPEYTDTELMETGMFDRIGRVYVTARVSEATEYLGSYDEEGEALLNRRLWEGRMPEKAGEIAIERGYLEQLRADIAVGDEISLELTAIDGLTETRTYALVGVLKDQSDNFSVSSYSQGSYGKLLSFPSLIVHEDEPAFATGRTVVHRLMTISPRTAMYPVMLAWEKKDTAFYGLYGGTWLYNFAMLEPYFDTETAWMLTGIIMLGLSLLTACGVGISQALEGRVARRREEIGMLRAVGATRRQIRRIFGREAWLLALVLAPVSVAAGCGFAYLASRIAPEMIFFKVDLRILLPVALFSFLCVLLSASLPLRRASRIMPMSVIRDTELLRKSRAVRGRKRFSAPGLISARQLRLNPTRQLGAAFLTMVMLICIILGINVALPEIFSSLGDGMAFSVSPPYIWSAGDFIDSLPRTGLTIQDVQQIASLDHVAYAHPRYSMQVNLAMEMEEAPDYLRYAAMGNDHLYEDGEFWHESAREEYEIVREVLGVEKEFAAFTLCVIDEAQVRNLEKYVESGRIDMAAVNAGREVIVYAPTVWLEVTYDDQGREIGHAAISGGEPEVWNRRIDNDAFYTGQALDIIQLFTYDDEAERFSQEDADYERKLYGSAYRADASVTVGAVLTAGDIDYTEANIYNACVITTVSGAQNMGIYLGSPDVNIALEGEVDLETEAYLEDRIEAIAMRGENTSVFNRMAWYREQQQMFRSALLMFLCMALVFFAVSVSIIAGNVGRRIRAESRLIGTLRAVGADAKAVAGCYTGQVLMSVGLGAVLALTGYGLFLALIDPYTRRYMAAYILPTVIAVLLVAAACFGCCYASLRMSLRSVMKRSIIENIREL